MMVILLLSVMFLSSIQPVMMVVSLILITLMYSMYMYMVLGGYWYSYALMMVILSGIMVVFMYMASLIPNESFEMYNLITVSLFLWLFLGKFKFLYGEDMSTFSYSLWNSYVGVISLLLVVFLFGMMLLVVWVSSFNSGAVRVT